MERYDEVVDAVANRIDILGLSEKDISNRLGFDFRLEDMSTKCKNVEYFVSLLAALDCNVCNCFAGQHYEGWDVNSIYSDLSEIIYNATRGGCIDNTPDLISLIENEGIISLLDYIGIVTNPYTIADNFIRDQSVVSYVKKHYKEKDNILLQLLSLTDRASESETAFREDYRNNMQWLLYQTNMIDERCKRLIHKTTEDILNMSSDLSMRDLYILYTYIGQNVDTEFKEYLKRVS